MTNKPESIEMAELCCCNKECIIAHPIQLFVMFTVYLLLLNFEAIIDAGTENYKSECPNFVFVLKLDIINFSLICNCSYKNLVKLSV